MKSGIRHLIDGINSSKKLLENKNFLSNAKPEVIQLTKNKLKDFIDKYDVAERDMMNVLSEKWFGNPAYGIQYMRDKKYFETHSVTVDTCLYDKDYFDYVYNSTVDINEYIDLHETTA